MGCPQGCQVRKNGESDLGFSPACSFCRFIYIQDGNMNVHISPDVRLLSLCTSRFTDFTGLPSETPDAKKPTNQKKKPNHNTCLKKKRIYLSTLLAEHIFKNTMIINPLKERQRES